ncbi:hypothetical protein TNCV_1499901 [Trichonephila clavipes]|nr:hypothetical protein TNCV_1499901 [Trichonephila clavipes]
MPFLTIANIVNECLQSEDITRMESSILSDFNAMEHVWDIIGWEVTVRQPPLACLLEIGGTLLDEWINLP